MARVDQELRLFFNVLRDFLRFYASPFHALANCRSQRSLAGVHRCVPGRLEGSAHGLVNLGTLLAGVDATAQGTFKQIQPGIGFEPDSARPAHWAQGDQILFDVEKRQYALTEGARIGFWTDQLGMKVQRAKIIRGAQP
jgi:hypothetical protein